MSQWVPAPDFEEWAHQEMLNQFDDQNDRDEEARSYDDGEEEYEEVSFNPQSTQEEKLLKVRAELLNKIRIQSNVISDHQNRIIQLEMEIAFLKSTVTRALTQTAPAETKETPAAGDFVSFKTVQSLLRGRGVKVVVATAVQNTLHMMGYFTPYKSGYKITPKGKGLIRETLSAGGYVHFEYSRSFVLNTLIPVMQKMEGVLDD